MWFASPWPHPGRAVGVGVCGSVGTGFDGGVVVVGGPAAAVVGREVVGGGGGGDAVGEVGTGTGTAGVGGAWVGGGAVGSVDPAAGFVPVWGSGRPEA
jgi:hypothetical protein